MRLSPVFGQAEGSSKSRGGGAWMSTSNTTALRGPSVAMSKYLLAVALLILTAMCIHHIAASKSVVANPGSTSTPASAASNRKVPFPHPPLLTITNNRRPLPATPSGKESTTPTARHTTVAVPVDQRQSLELTTVPMTAQLNSRDTTHDEIDKGEAQLQKAPHFVKVTWNAVKEARINPEHEAVIPVFVTPVFHDATELMELLASIDVPVRTFQIVWNSDNEQMKNVLDELRHIPFGVVIHHHPENIGFSGAVNTGIRTGQAALSDPPARWFFIVNADASFPPGNLQQFAETINSRKLYDTNGLVYGPRQDHFAFVITRAAVRAVGYMDEAFYPGYMEDIDYHWRVRLAGLDQTITKIHFIHKQSVNLKRPGTGTYKQMLGRAANGWEYGWMKWGHYGPGDIEKAVPPSGFKTPFDIPGAPLSLWKIDPAHRECIRTGHGQYHVQSSTCWFNGTGLLSHPGFPSGQQLTVNLVTPQPSGALSRLNLHRKKQRF